MDWGVGKITFSPCWPQATPAYPNPPLDRLQQYQRWLTDAKAVEPDPLAWNYEAERQFPCGWDERDAKV